VSVFRPAARVRTPDGREWEIYAYKTRAKPRRESPRRLRRVADAIGSHLRALRSDAWTIEAVAFTPSRAAYTWTTTREYRGQVLAQVEGHLARGDVPTQLTNADFRGETGYVKRSARYRNPIG
jgi:hypothetical protein